MKGFVTLLVFFTSLGELSSQPVARFLWTPVMRPFDYRPTTGPNRYDPSKTGQTFDMPSNWNRYPNHFKRHNVDGTHSTHPTTIKSGNLLSTRTIRGSRFGGPMTTYAGIPGESPSLEIYGAPQRSMLDSEERVGDFFLNYRTDTFTSPVAHGFNTRDLVKFDLLPTPRGGQDDNRTWDLPGIISEEGHYVKDLSGFGFRTLPSGGHSFVGPGGQGAFFGDLNSTLFSVRKIDDFRFTLHKNAQSAIDNGNPVNFVINQPIITPQQNPPQITSPPLIATPTGLNAITQTDYTLDTWKDITVTTDSVEDGNITVDLAAETLTLNTGNNLITGQGIYFDQDPPAPLTRNTTYYVRDTGAGYTLHNTKGGANGNFGIINLTDAGTSYTLFKTFFINAVQNFVVRPNTGLTTGDLIYVHPADNFSNHGLNDGEHYFVSVNQQNNQIWFHTSDTDAGANGPEPLNGGLNPVGLNDAVADEIGGHRSPIYARIPVPSTWRQDEDLARVTTLSDNTYSVDNWTTTPYPVITDVNGTLNPNGNFVNGWRPIRESQHVASIAGGNDHLQYVPNNCPWSTKDEVFFLNNGAGSSIPAPLVAGTPYYLNVVQATGVVHVHASRDDALNFRNPIPITSVGAGYLVYSTEKMALSAAYSANHTLRTGDRIEIEGIPNAQGVVPGTGGSGTVRNNTQWYISVDDSASGTAAVLVDPAGLYPRAIYLHTSHAEATWAVEGPTPGRAPVDIYNYNPFTTVVTDVNLRAFKLRVPDTSELQNGDTIRFAAPAPVGIFGVGNAGNFVPNQRYYVSVNEHGDVYFHNAPADATARPNGNGNDQTFGSGNNQLDVMEGILGLPDTFFFFRENRADRDANTPWTDLTTGTPVQLSGTVPPPLNDATLYYVSVSGKDIGFHTDLANAMAGSNPIAFTATSAADLDLFTVSIVDRLEFTPGHGLQNGDRIRFTTPGGITRPDFAPNTLNGLIIHHRDDPAFPVTPPVNANYNALYVSIDPDNANRVILHENYEDARAGQYPIPINQVAGGPWSIEYERPVRITGRQLFETTANHNLVDGDVLYITGGTTGRIPVGLSLNTPYSVYHSGLGSIDRIRTTPNVITRDQATDVIYGNNGRIRLPRNHGIPRTFGTIINIYDEQTGNGIQGQGLPGNIFFIPQDSIAFGNQITGPANNSVLNWGPLDQRIPMPAAGTTEFYLRWTTRPTDPGEDPSGPDRGFSGLLTQGRGAGQSFYLSNNNTESGVIETASTSDATRTANTALGIDPNSNMAADQFFAYLDSGTAKFRIRKNTKIDVVEEIPTAGPIDINLNRTIRREYRSEFRLKFLRHNFYRYDTTDLNASDSDYWSAYRYYATYEAQTLNDNRAGLDANRTFLVTGIPVRTEVNFPANLSVIIPRSEHILEDFPTYQVQGTANQYTCSHLINPWLGYVIQRPNNHFYINNHGYDSTMYTTGGRRFNWAPPPNAPSYLYMSDPIAYRTTHAKGTVAIRAEQITHPEDLDMDNLWEVTRTVALGGNPLDVTFTPNALGTAARVPFTNEDAWVSGPRWRDLSFVRNDNGLNMEYLPGGDPNDPIDPATLGYTGGVGPTEYNRNNGYTHTRMFGDFFVSPLKTTTQIAGGNQAGDEAGANQTANNLLTGRNNLISTRNLSEVLRFGDLGNKIRLLNRLPTGYGPEYIFIDETNPLLGTRLNLAR